MIAPGLARWLLLVALLSACGARSTKDADAGHMHADAGASGTHGGKGGTGGHAAGGSGGASGADADAGLDASAAADTDAGADAATPWVEPTETIDLAELPTSVPTVAIEISAQAIAQLDAHPYDAADVTGVFVDEHGTRYEGIELNYRGAYALRGLIQSGGPQRNWKVKVTKALPYRGRREWNFNFEPHVRQKLTYDLMRFAGVKVPSARHVLLTVNGTAQGLYLEYEDPDNKAWLRDKLGDDTGDLYKAATDLPDMPRYFATTEYLGDTDAAYLLHYNKKTNNDVPPVSYARLRTFLYDLNHVSDAELPAWVEAHFDWRKLVQYLVVANFASSWDGLPQRPKNYWLYEIRRAGHWVFIPWDLDGTYSVTTSGLNPMGTTASVFYQFDSYESYSAEQGEGTERPLIRRLMKHKPFRDAYVAAYREALGSYLAKQYLMDRVTALETLLVGVASSSDAASVQSSSDTIRQFIQLRHDHVQAELDAL